MYALSVLLIAILAALATYRFERRAKTRVGVAPGLAPRRERTPFQTAFLVFLYTLLIRPVLMALLMLLGLLYFLVFGPMKPIHEWFS